MQSNWLLNGRSLNRLFDYIAQGLKSLISVLLETIDISQ